MNKYILGILILSAVIGGGYYVLTTQQEKTSEKGQMSEDTHGNAVAQSHRGYEIEVVSGTVGVKTAKETTIVYKIKNDKGETLKKFETVHEQIMHFIVVRHDLQHFEHLHPDFNALTGEFRLQIAFPTDGPYRMFPDFTPRDDNPQKLPVTVFSDITVGDASQYKQEQIRPDTSTTKKYGDYEITFTVPKVNAQKEFTYSLMIEKNGQPVNDLEKYLGALGHSVILKEGTLEFIHTHAVNVSGSEHGQMPQHSPAGGSGNGPEIRFSTTLPESGVYKQFTQFQHQGNVITVNYVMKADK